MVKGGHLVNITQDEAPDAETGSVTRDYYVSKIEERAVEQDGPVRAVVRIEGQHRETRGNGPGRGRSWLPRRNDHGRSRLRPRRQRRPHTVRFGAGRPFTPGENRDARSTAAGAQLVRWPSNGGTNQHFEFVDAGDDRCRLEARHSGLVLQVASTASGADTAQQPESDTASQQWRIVDHGGALSLVNRVSGLAMDVWEWSTADGARISQWNYTGDSNQRFTLQAV